MTVPQPQIPQTPSDAGNPFAQQPPTPPKGPSRAPVFILAALLVVSLVALAIVVMTGSSGKPAAVGQVAGPSTQPVAVMDDAITIGSASARTTVDLYLDYMCPFCGTFDRMNGPDIAAGVEDGTVLLRLHPMSFLDQASAGTNYSTRAANAVVTVARLAPASVLAFHMELFTMQPMENSPGLSDAQIADLAATCGVPQDVVAQFAAGTENAWVEAATKASFAAGITGTPTVKVNNTKVETDLYHPGALKQALGVK